MLAVWAQFNSLCYDNNHILLRYMNNMICLVIFNQDCASWSSQRQKGTVTIHWWHQWLDLWCTFTIFIHTQWLFVPLEWFFISSGAIQGPVWGITSWTFSLQSSGQGESTVSQSTTTPQSLGTQCLLFAALSNVIMFLIVCPPTLLRTIIL